VGWFGFNAGSAYQSGPVAINAVFTTQMGVSFAALVWVLLSMRFSVGFAPSMGDVMNGVLAGLAGITPASGFVSPQSAMVIGVVLGLFSYIGCRFLKSRFGVDDALDVSVVHGLTGIIGSLAIGFCGSSDVNPAGANGLFNGGGGRLLLHQFIGVTAACAWTYVMMLLLLIVVDYLTGGIRQSLQVCTTTTTTTATLSLSLSHTHTHFLSLALSHIHSHTYK
jgi:Amt family ammonium transporter